MVVVHEDQRDVLLHRLHFSSFVRAILAYDGITLTQALLFLSPPAVGSLSVTRSRSADHGVTQGHFLLASPAKTRLRWTSNGLELLDSCSPTRASHGACKICSLRLIAIQTHRRTFGNARDLVSQEVGIGRACRPPASKTKTNKQIKFRYARHLPPLPRTLLLLLLRLREVCEFTNCVLKKIPGARIRLGLAS